MSPAGEIRHAGLVALYDRSAWRGVLIEGPSGAGKSDLALRCLARGLRLVADDRVVLWACRGRLFGAAPGPLHGLVEARGVGVLAEPALRFAEVALVVRCLEAHEPLERVPAPETREILGVRLPAAAVRPLEASAPEKVLRALSLLGGAP